MSYNVLFVEPPVDYLNPPINLGCNLGINTIIGYVKRYCDVNIQFYSFEYAKALNDTLDIDSVLDRFSPNMVCISVLTHSYPFALKLSQAAKTRNCLVLWGGIFVTYNSQAIKIRHSAVVDFLVVGDGEYIIPSLINEIKNKPQKQGSTRILSCDMSSIKSLEYCIPDFSFIPKELISEHQLRATFELTKGCSYQCKFCCVKGTLHHLNNKKTANEMELELDNIKSYGFGKTLICDNNFFPSTDQYAIFKEIRNNICPTMRYRITVRADLIDEKSLEEYKSIGVDELIMGVEHVDPKILRSMKKTVDPDNWEKRCKYSVKLANDFGFMVHPIFMLGWPGETRESLSHNCDTACSLGVYPNVEPFVSFLTPHPGSETVKFIEEKSVRLITSDYSKFIHLYPVSIPVSYGQYALADFIDAHNKIRTVSNMTYRNPCFDYEFVKSYADLI